MKACCGISNQILQSPALKPGAHVLSLFMKFQGAPSPIWWKGSLPRIGQLWETRSWVDTQDSLRIFSVLPSKEIRMLVKIIEDDPRSTTCNNIRYLRKLTNIDNAEKYSSWRIRKELPKMLVPESENWRLGLHVFFFIRKCKFGFSLEVS